jgi:hypothetical protein
MIVLCSTMKFAKGNTLSVIMRENKAVEMIPVSMEQLREAKVEPVRPGNDKKK